MQNKRIYISGMHCKSCQKILSDEIQNIKSVKKVVVDYKNGWAEISYDQDYPNFKKIAEKINQLGYQVKDPQNPSCSIAPKATFLDWIYSFLIVFGLLFLYRLLQNFGIIDKFNFADTSNITLGIAFLVGITASLSTCLMVVGSMVITFAQKFEAQGKNSLSQVLKPNLIFHFGRLTAFFLLGGLLGLIGKQITLGQNFLFIFTLLIGAVMLWLGLNIIGLVPSISRLGLTLPINLFSSFERRWKASNHSWAPFMLGAISFFLPCGFTQTMQIFALSTGSFWTGGLSLFLFALGTTPVLLFLGTGVAWFKNKNFLAFQKAIGLLVVLFAIYTFNSGLAIKGKTLFPQSTSLVSAPTSQSEPEKNTASNSSTETKKDQLADSSQEQVVKMSITSRGFEPSTFKIKKDIPVKWIINGDRASGCTNAIIVPSLNIEQDIKKGDNVIQFLPQKAGKIAFSCWMGMVRGEFVVN